MRTGDKRSLGLARGHSSRLGLAFGQLAEALPLLLGAIVLSHIVECTGQLVMGTWVRGIQLCAALECRDGRLWIPSKHERFPKVIKCFRTLWADLGSLLQKRLCGFPFTDLQQQMAELIKHV